MVITASGLFALIASVASLAQASPQSGPAPQAQQAPQPPDSSPAYTLSGVRRAAAGSDKPDAQAEPPAPPAQPPRKPLAKSGVPQQFNIETWAPPKPAFRLPDDDRLVTPSLAPRGPAWHQEFLAMTRPEYGGPFDMMTNGERGQAVVSSLAFGLAIDGLTRLVQSAIRSYRNGNVEKVRREIEAERLEVERQYLARKAQEEAPASIRKAPR